MIDDDPRKPLVMALIEKDQIYASKVMTVNVADAIARILTEGGGIAELAEYQGTDQADIEKRLGFTISMLSHLVATALLDEAVASAAPAPGEVDQFLKDILGG